MPSDHPQTPESPSQASLGVTNTHRKTSTSPQVSNSLPTPAHSINGSISALGADSMASGFSQEDPSNKRKRDVEDNGERDQKKVHLEAAGLSIEDLHLDVGEKYLLCRMPHPSQIPHLSQDLFAMYSLNNVAQSVARTNPDGTKNPLRKTYKKYIKTLGLSGAFDVGKKELDAPDTLSALLLTPDDQWETHNTLGRRMGMGFSDEAKASMSTAFKMAKGRIPKDRFDSSVLGEIVTRPADSSKSLSNGTKAHPPQNPAVARTAKGEGPRPKRNVKKRSYGDASYEGYGEGYIDDENQDTGYSTGEGDDRGGRKRPKKNAPPNYQGPLRQSGYGPGMVGA